MTDRPMSYYHRFRAIDIWEPKDQGRLTRYRCCENLDSGKFFVLLKDEFVHPVHADQQIEREISAINRMAREDALESEGERHDSLEEAIEAFDLSQKTK